MSGDRDGDAIESSSSSSFNITEWLTDEVKLPQYSESFLQQGFQFPAECFQIDEEVLNLLGIEKIGHRKRILVSCQKLGRKYGIHTSANDVVQPELFVPQQSATQASNDGAGHVDDDDIPPVLPPKLKICEKTSPRPPPPPRRDVDTAVPGTVKQEVQVEGNASSISEDVIVEVSTKTRDDLVDLTLMQLPNIANNDEMYNSTQVASEQNNSTERKAEGESSGQTPPFSPGFAGYEPLWEASEGEPLPLSPDKCTNTETLATGLVTKCSNDEVSTSVSDSKQSEQILTKPTDLPPPPIPPRSDLDDVVEASVKPKAVNNNIITEPPLVTVSEETSLITKSEDKQPLSLQKKVRPKKPPRSKKPVSMLIEPTNAPPRELEGKCGGSLGANAMPPPGDMHHYDNDVFVAAESDEKTNIDNDILLNIYGNVEESQPKQAADKGAPTPSAKRPIPAPRDRTLSGKKENKNLSIFELTPEPSGSCTEDDLSGSDQEILDEKPESPEYETVSLPPRPTSYVQPRHAHKEGYLFKQGGQQNNKGWKKRWVVFDEQTLRYYKDKEHTSESLQVVPVAIMKEVRIVTEDTKRARFDLTCSGRTYMFALDTHEMDVIQVWAQILMQGMISFRKENEGDILSIPGGIMSDPDKQGFLKKQGNNVVVDYKKRYIAIKDDKFAYYHNREDFIHGSPINTLKMQIASVKVDPKSPLRFQLVTPHRMYIFQCEDDRELRAWVSAVETSIQLALSDRTVINKVWENSNNRYCADCGKKDPLWASVNLVVCVCEHCIGVHRKLGVHTSKPRSLLMDQKIWKPSLIKLMVDVGNEVSNKFWLHMCPEDDLISQDSLPEARNEFIRNKYQERRYRHVSQYYGFRDEIGKALRKSVVTNDIETTMQLVFCGAEVKYVPDDSEDQRTPYELAKDANQELQMEFLLQNGANVESEPSASPAKTLDTTESFYTEISEYETVQFVPDRQTIPVTYEKEGNLQKKAPTAAVWKTRHFFLKGRELFYDKGEKEEQGVIKLREVTDYIYNNTVTLDIVTPERTYNLRAETKEDALSWYTTLRNKQVFQIPLANQELGSDGIPHLVAKCVQFIETYGLVSEGIYRKNGNKAKIKILKKLFDQDAESVLLSQEEYEPHDVAGLLKEYFRELPDPLMTVDAYPHFITASLTPDHDSKMHMYKDGLARLGDVNRNTLKTTIGHLVRICTHSAQNLMKLENLSLLFGPTLMSNDQMGAMDTQTINQEFAVMGDFITFYKWLFDVDDEEERKDKKIEEARKKMLELSSQQTSRDSKVNELTLDVYSLNNRQESCRITVDSNCKASKICQEVVAKKGMAPDGNWALFQIVNGEIERPFPATEKVLDTVIEIGQYSQLVKDSYLVVKENNLGQKIQLYGFIDDVHLVAAHSLQTMKEGKKKDKWGKLFVKLEKGLLSVHKNMKSKDDIDSWPVSETTLYLGVGRDKKPVTGFGFTIARMKDQQCSYRYLCVDDEREMYRWISIFLKLKYPGKPLWVDPDLEPIGYYAEATIPGMQPPASRQISSSRILPGVSSNVVNELRARQRSLRQ